MTEISAPWWLLLKIDIDFLSDSMKFFQNQRGGEINDRNGYSWGSIRDNVITILSQNLKETIGWLSKTFCLAT